jgi:choline dehydrogenase-like flavoprotein
MGIPNGPLPRAVIDCKGCGDCITGCFGGAKQSVDRSWVPAAVAAGLRVFTCAQVERVLTAGERAVGVSGQVVDIDGWVRRGAFTVHAPLVVMAPGVMATPCILIRSGINPGGRVGATLNMHLTGGVVAIMDEVVDPWVGASQGWGAIHPDIEGLKLESLWAAPSLIAVKWGGIGEAFLRQLQDIKHATLLACVYAGKTRGTVRPKRDGSPSMRLWIDDAEVRPIQRALKQAADGFLDVGAREIHSMIPGLKAPMVTKDDTAELVSPRIKARDISMTGNHVFGSVRMSADARRGPVDLDGRLRGVDGLYVVDTSIFPAPSQVNPQATVMVLADLITRRLAELPV